MATICLPFFLLIGFLSTNSGMAFWRGKRHHLLQWLSTLGTKALKKNDPIPDDPRKHLSASVLRGRTLTSSPLLRNKQRSLSASEATRIRNAQLPLKASSASVISARPAWHASTASGTQLQVPGAIVPGPANEAGPANSTAPKKAIQAIMSVLSTEKRQVTNQESKSSSWWGKMTPWRRRDHEHDDV